MKELGCAEVIMEKNMQRTEFTEVRKAGFAILIVFYSCWLVKFSQYSIEDSIATIAVKETDLKQIASIDAIMNSRIHAQFTA